MRPYLPERGYASHDCRYVSTSGKLEIKGVGSKGSPFRRLCQRSHSFPSCLRQVPILAPVLALVEN